MNAPNKYKQITVSTHVYRNEDRTPRFRSERRELRYKHDGSPVLDKKSGKPEKQFPVSRSDGNGGWISGQGDLEVIPYCLPELKDAIVAKKRIHVFEGEGKVDLARDLGLKATCNMYGSGKWKSEYNKHFADAEEICILPDNDKVGVAHAETAKQNLLTVAKNVKIVWLDGLPPAGDIKDWLANGHTVEELNKRIDAGELGEPYVFEEPAAEDGDENGTANAKPNGKTKSQGVTKLHFKCAADIETKHVDWVWTNRVARGKITMFAGDPGIGKSQVAIDIIARITNGSSWPDEGVAPQGNAIILSAEDAANDTLVPRLEAKGADLKRASILTAVTTDDKHRTFSLQADLDALGEEITRMGDVVVVVIDPVTSYMGQIGHRTTDVRAVFEPLSSFAEKHNVAIIVIRHPPKATQIKAINSITGSLAFVAAPRLVFLGIKEPESSSGRRLFLAVKNNLGPEAPGIGFSLLQKVVEEETKKIAASYIEWDGIPVTLTADQALDLMNAKHSNSALTEAMEFLQEELAGGPKPVKEVQSNASTAGIAPRTLRRAQEKLKIKSKKGGLTGGWVLVLPSKYDGPSNNSWNGDL